MPRAIVYHVHSATYGEFSLEKAFLVERNRVWVMVKTFPLVLVILSPLFTLARFLFHAYGSLFHVGSSGRFAKSGSRMNLAITMLKAYWSAASHLVPMWRSRGEIRKFKKIGAGSFMRLLWKHRISLSALTLGS
jgi:GT2 family glycosyltransferase